MTFMLDPWSAGMMLGLVVVLVALRRRDRAASSKLAAEQRQMLDDLVEDVALLREALVVSGAVERAPKLPLAPAPATPASRPHPLPSVKREVVTVTRDDDPVHTRPTVEAPPPAGEEHAPEPPTTKPSGRRSVPASLSPRSAPRQAPVEDDLTRAMKRIERLAKVPPEVEARWEERLRALGAELRLVPGTEPTDAQIEAMIRELYEAEADVKDARPSVPPPSLAATLSSAVSPIAAVLPNLAPANHRAPASGGEA